MAASATPIPRPNNNPTQKPLNPPSGPVRCSTKAALTATNPTTASARQDAVCRRGTTATMRFQTVSARRTKLSKESVGPDVFDISPRPTSSGPGRGAGVPRELGRRAEHTMCGSETPRSGRSRRIGNDQRSRGTPAPRPGPVQRRPRRQQRTATTPKGYAGTGSGATNSDVNASITSPFLRSEKRAICTPHSKFSATSRTSSLNRRSDSSSD